MRILFHIFRVLFSQAALSPAQFELIIDTFRLPTPHESFLRYPQRLLKGILEVRTPSSEQPRDRGTRVVKIKER